MNLILVLKKWKKIRGDFTLSPTQPLIGSEIPENYVNGAISLNFIIKFKQQTNLQHCIIYDFLNLFAIMVFIYILKFHKIRITLPIKDWNNKYLSNTWLLIMYPQRTTKIVIGILIEITPLVSYFKVIIWFRIRLSWQMLS